VGRFGDAGMKKCDHHWTYGQRITKRGAEKISVCAICGCHKGDAGMKKETYVEKVKRHQAIIEKFPGSPAYQKNVEKLLKVCKALCASRAKRSVCVLCANAELFEKMVKLVEKLEAKK